MLPKLIGSRGLESFTLSSVLFKNSMPIGGSDLDFSFESTMIKESKMETSHASTQTWGLGYSLAVGVSVGVPVFGDVSATTTYSLTYGNSEMFTNTEGTVSFLQFCGFLHRKNNNLANLFG